MAGQRQRRGRLASLLADLGRRPAPVRPPAPRLETMPIAAQEHVLELFRQLGGGGGPTPSLRPGAWDVVLADGLIVELDEEQHFNRYRDITLARPWTDALPWAEDYRRYCLERETESLRKAKRGGYWTSPSTEAMFGPADPPGVFDRAGSPRWKQRALYDAMRDALAVAGGARLARVSVWDTVGDSTLGRVLDGRVEADLEELAELVETRTLRAGRTPDPARGRTPGPTGRR